MTCLPRSTAKARSAGRGTRAPGGPVELGQGRVAALAISRDGTQIFGLHDQRGAFRVDTRSGGLEWRGGVGLGAARAVNADQHLVAFTIASRGGERVVIWRPDDRQALAELALPADAGAVVDLAFSPVGDRVLITTTSGPLQLWDLRAGTAAPIARFGKTGDRFLAAAFDQDGLRIAGALGDGTVMVWRIFVDRQTLIEFAQGLVPEGLSDAEQCQFGLLSEAECILAER